MTKFTKFKEVKEKSKKICKVKSTIAKQIIPSRMVIMIDTNEI